MKTLIAGALLMGLLACGSDPMQGALPLLKAGKLEAALTELEASRDKRPEAEAVRFTLFSLYRYLSEKGEGSKTQERLNACITEYRWIVAHFGLTPSYTDME